MALHILIHKFRILAVAGLLTIGSLMAVAPVHAVDQGGLGGKPAYPNDQNNRSQSIFVTTLDPGEQSDDGVQVINNTDETKKVLLYAVDSQASSDGAFACAQESDESMSVGSWIELEKSELTLEAGEKQVVDFTITVPDDASPGEHNGCIVIQDTERQTASGSNGIVLSLRSAIRVAVTVPGEIKKDLVFTGIDGSVKDSQKITTSVTLKNNGNVSLDTLVDIKLTYPLGMTAAEVGGSFPVLSDTEGRLNFDADRPFWGGWYRLTATAQYNDQPDTAIGEGDPNKSIERSTWIFIEPKPLAAAIEGAFAVLLVGVIYWVVVRRIRRKKDMQRATTHVVKQNEDLRLIAKEYDMSWKHLARINKLKAPYSLRVNQQLTVIPSRKTNKHKN